MRRALITLLIVLAILPSGECQKKPFPVPAKIEYGGTEANVIEVNQVNYRIFQNNNRIWKKELLTHHYETIDYFDNLIKRSANKEVEVLAVDIQLRKIDQPQEYVSTDIDESYKIEIGADKSVSLRCQNYVSLVRAMNVFSQLIQDGKITHFPIIIEDSPSYQHRGVMIDTSRTFLPITKIYDLLKGMQKAALNVLHWHITDSESFPIQLYDYSEIPSYGAYSSQEIYSAQQIQQLIFDAQKRGIIIIPEIDSPGHTRSWALSPELQELNSCFGYPPQDWEKYCLEPPCGQLDPTMNKTYEVVQSVLSQVDSYFTSSYFHFGGDEVSPGCWDYRPSIKAWMQQQGIANYPDLENYYMNRIVKFINKSKTPIFWFQASQANATYPNNSIIQFWGDSSQYDLLKKFNQRVILSPVDFLYFDCGAGNQLGENTWCDPWITWGKVYRLNLTATGVKDRILGAEATLWSEMISPQNFDWRVWPRASALALRLWNENLNLLLPDLVESLQFNVDQLYEIGLKPGPVTVEYCYKNIARCFSSTNQEKEPEQIKEQESATKTQNNIIIIDQ